MQNLEVVLLVVEDVLLFALLVTYVAVSSVATNIYHYRPWSRVVACKLFLRQVAIRRQLYVDKCTHVCARAHPYV